MDLDEENPIIADLEFAGERGSTDLDLEQAVYIYRKGGEIVGVVVEKLW